MCVLFIDIDYVMQKYIARKIEPCACILPLIDNVWKHANENSPKSNQRKKKEGSEAGFARIMKVKKIR